MQRHLEAVRWALEWAWQICTRECGGEQCPAIGVIFVGCEAVGPRQVRSGSAGNERCRFQIVGPPGAHVV